MKAGLNQSEESKAETRMFPSDGSPVTAATPQQLSRLFPQLVIERLIGQGGMGAVYLARQKSLDRPVALKIIRPESAGIRGFAERFTREAKSLARLNHPHIVGVHDFGSVHPELHEKDRTAGRSDAPELFFLIMEYVDGANLRELIVDRSLTPREALAIVPQICDALQFAHDAGIVHRDIKPENILVDRQGRVKIADFGLAKLLADPSSDHSLTGTHQVMGTPRYMAPEQLEQSRNIDHRADIYSLGVVFYEMLTGELPVGAFEPPSHKVHIDVRLDEVVLRALAREPARRYQQASQVKTDIESVNVKPQPGSNRWPKKPMASANVTESRLHGKDILSEAVEPGKGNKTAGRSSVAEKRSFSLDAILKSTSNWGMLFCILAAISPAFSPLSYHDVSYADWHGAAISIAGGVGFLFLIATGAMHPIPWWRTVGITVIGVALITFIVIFASKNWNDFPYDQVAGLLAILSSTGLLAIASVEFRTLAERVKGNSAGEAKDTRPGPP
jgi:serine/threonine protein kinase